VFKLGQHLAIYKRQCEKAGRPVSEQKETNIRNAFLCVLNALTPEAYQCAVKVKTQIESKKEP
jgi:hypothetical protein